MNTYDNKRLLKKQIEATDALIDFLKEKKIISKDKKTTKDLRWYIGMIYGTAYNEGVRAMEREDKRRLKSIYNNLGKDNSDFAKDVLREINKGVA